jgi:hypothetical protein
MYIRTLQAAPLHPELQVHTLGAVHAPFTQPDGHTAKKQHPNILRNIQV